MVLRPCARLSKQPMIVGGHCIWFQNHVWRNDMPCIWFKNHVWGNDAMFVTNKIKNNKKYYMSAINNIKY